MSSSDFPDMNCCWNKLGYSGTMCTLQLWHFPASIYEKYFQTKPVFFDDIFLQKTFATLKWWKSDEVYTEIVERINLVTITLWIVSSFVKKYLLLILQTKSYFWSCNIGLSTYSEPLCIGLTKMWPQVHHLVFTTQQNWQNIHYYFPTNGFTDWLKATLWSWLLMVIFSPLYTPMPSRRIFFQQDTIVCLDQCERWLWELEIFSLHWRTLQIAVKDKRCILKAII